MSNKKLLNESQVRQFMKLARLEPLTQGFVEGLNEADEPEELEELRTGRTGALGPADGTHPSRGRGQGEAASGAMNEDAEEVEEGMGMYRDDEDDIEDAEHDMDHADDLEMDAEEDMADVGDADRGGMIAVDDFLSALESALESVLGDEVEIDSDEMDADEDEVEMDVEVDAVDDVEDDIMQEGDDEELEEGTKKGDIKKADLKKDGHHGRGPKRRETAKEEDELAYEKNESAEATDELVEQITKRVAARILKSALAKK